ncbi:Bug family tripartite tricarboxylate transporter substrate binding protein [Rhodovulum kholense]|uniref:Putative tricarboxylic transport membrane protein n=1 Tax=Rhodovulum kholense TaxID=453584 RepID=A0A8E3APT9_9RHOB|nr:tripartite tricarboxylate transporter substrate-binding protein [Rhodovulum kholense]PTW45248.1 putative tricarboxylic transport membrane protein [Rhodovulum kholense]
MSLKSAAAAACVALAAALPALAEIDAPECVAPAQPGGGFDLTCRIAQQGLDGAFDRPIEVTFMPGGIGAVAFNQFNTTRTDDSNAIVAFSSGSLLNIATGKFGTFTENDVRFLATAGADYGAVIVRADSPYADLGALMDAFKADPGSVVVGAGGSVGSQDWMKGALLLKSVGADPRQMRYVAYDGGGDAIAGLLGGAIQVYTGDVGEMAAHIGDGSMRILAVLAPERLEPPFDAYPTAKELGYDTEWTIMRGFYMGKNVPDADYQAWADAFAAAYKTEAYRQARESKGLMPLELSGPEMDAQVKQLIGELRDIARDAGLIQ